MNKYEQLIEYIINEQEDQARELFHQIVVEKSRDIYESLIDEEDFDEAVGGNQVDSLVDEVETDETGMQEANDDLGVDDEMSSDVEASDADMDDVGSEMDNEIEMGGDIEGAEGDTGVEEKIQDLETALDELKAEFEALMAGEEHEEEMEPGIHGGELEAGDEGDTDAEFDVEPAEESMVREYVEKVGHDWPKGESEGSAVGAKGETTSVNKKSIVAGKNDMGGTASNIVKGGTETAADGKPTPTPSNQYTKGRGELKGAGSFENVPGAKTKGYTKKATSYEKAKGKEGQTTDGKMAVDTKSLVGGKVR